MTSERRGFVCGFWPFATPRQPLLRESGWVILIDEPMWGRHGRVWGHVVSDTSLAELHEFAERAGVPKRAFDRDHYDYPAELQEQLIALGATLVTGGELTRRLIASGLRVRARDR